MLYARHKIFFIILLTALTGSLLHAQEPDSLVLADSADLHSFYEALADSITVADSLSSDTLDAQRSAGGEIEAEVRYNATDSLIFSLDGGMVELFGDATITYEDITLEADYIRYEVDSNLVVANGLPDSTGSLAGKPVFTDASSSFESKTMRYNFKTKKAYVEEVVTQQEGGYLHAEQTKKQSNGHVHLKDGKYTTCDAEHPHFYIAITKGISMPGDKIIAGPAYLVLADVPLPIGLPFGFFPNSTTKTSGILIPKYGEEDRRGFYLREGGYYFAMNDYMDLRVTGDIYTNGTWGVRVGSNYKWNYRFGGNLNVRYFKNVSGDKNIEDTYTVSKDYAIGWSHNQDSRANPSSTFRASVNLSSSSYDKNHTRNINSVMRNTKQSSISYTKSFPNSPFNLSASLNHSQNSSTKQVNMTLPKISFNMSRITPFKRKSGTGPKRFYEDIQLSYTSLLENRISTYDSLLFTSQVWDDMKNGYKHSIPLSLSIKPFRKTPMLQSFAITPSIKYNGILYSKQTEKYFTYEDENDDQGNFIRRNYTVYDTLINKISYAQSILPSIGAGFAPKVYGMYTFKGKGRLEQIRHVMTPTAGISYVPDLSAIQADYYRDLVDPETGDTVTTYSIYEDQIYGTPTARGASGSLNFSLRNNIEAKMRSKADTIDELEKVKLLDNLGFSTSLNLFHTDTLTPAWTPISFSGNTRIFKDKLNLSFRGVLDPFGYDTASNISRTRETWFSQTGKPLRLTGTSVSAGFTLKSKKEKPGSKEGQEDMDSESQLNRQDMAGDDPNDNYDPNVEEFYGDYVDFDIPWSLRIDYSFGYSKPMDEAKIVQTLRASGDFSLSPNWKIGFNTGYDIDKRSFTTTNLSIYRDLHCWEMRISVVPFGTYKSYNFQINAKSSILKDLKYNKRKSWVDNF
ncbi:MAG: putative LPS assembly protein LptD [Bacteroidota bacterium]|nr:putative LPS assembly protein LptD [Bacteroidota bacterium]